MEITVEKLQFNLRIKQDYYHLCNSQHTALYFNLLKKKRQVVGKYSAKSPDPRKKCEKMCSEGN